VSTISEACRGYGSCSPSRPEASVEPRIEVIIVLATPVSNTCLAICAGGRPALLDICVGCAELRQCSPLAEVRH
jgi:hypothetical protein